MTINVSLLEAYADVDERKALVENGLRETARLESMIVENLTSENDRWLRTQLINQVMVIRTNLHKASS